MEGNVRMAEKALAFAVAALIDLSPESTYKNYFSKLNRTSFASLDMCLGVSSSGQRLLQRRRILLLAQR